MELDVGAIYKSSYHGRLMKVLGFEYSANQQSVTIDVVWVDPDTRLEEEESRLIVDMSDLTRWVKVSN